MVDVKIVNKRTDKISYLDKYIIQVIKDAIARNEISLEKDK